MICLTVALACSVLADVRDVEAGGRRENVRRVLGILLLVPMSCRWIPWVDSMIRGTMLKNNKY
jgi:hypothetical protein